MGHAHSLYCIVFSDDLTGCFKYSVTTEKKLMAFRERFTSLLVQHCVSFGDRVPDIFVSARRRSDGVAVPTTSFGNAALA